MSAKYLWLDLETTGLNPSRNSILEFATIVTNDGLDILEVSGGVLRFDLEEHQISGSSHYANIDDFVVEMHRKNGLWELCREATINVEGMQQFLLGVIGSFEWVEKKPILAGSTVHFDRSFLNRWCPTVEAKLHHRHLDVSSLKLAALDAWKINGRELSFPKAEAHRAAADVRESLDHARLCYAMIKTG